MEKEEEREIEGVEGESAVDSLNYKNVEYYATNAVYQLANTMETLLSTEDEKPLIIDNVDKAIDCADALVKVMAMFHKGREIETKREAMIKGVGMIAHDS
jgi:hypothetical protein